MIKRLKYLEQHQIRMKEILNPELLNGSGVGRTVIGNPLTRYGEQNRSRKVRLLLLPQFHNTIRTYSCCCFKDNDPCYMISSSSRLKLFLRETPTQLSHDGCTYRLITVKIIRSSAADNGEQNVNKYGVMCDLHNGGTLLLWHLLCNH